MRRGDGDERECKGSIGRVIGPTIDSPDRERLHNLLCNPAPAPGSPPPPNAFAWQKLFVGAKEGEEIVELAGR